MDNACKCIHFTYQKKIIIPINAHSFCLPIYVYEKAVDNISTNNTVQKMAWNGCQFLGFFILFSIYSISYCAPGRSPRGISK